MFKNLINTNKIFWLSLFIFFICSISIYGQSNKDNFIFFGYNPEIVNRQLYKSLSKTNEPSKRIIILDSIAMQFIESKNADSLFHYGSLLKNEILKLKNNQFKYQLKSLFYKGLGSQSMGLLDESIRYFIEGIGLLSEAKEKKGLIFQYFKLALAETYILRKYTLKANIILDEVAPICSTLKTLLYYKIARSNYYLLNNEFENAEKLIKKTLQTLNKERYQRIFIRFQIALGELKLLKGHLNESLTIFTKIKNKAIKYGYYDLYIAIILNQGKIYSVSNNNHQVAEIILGTAYANAVQWNQLNLQQKIVKSLVRVYVSKKNYKNAYNLKTQLDGINHRIISNQNKRFIRDLEFKYETLKKEKKIHKLQENQINDRTEIEYQKKVKYGILIAFLIILIPIILLLVVYYQKLQTQSLLTKQQEILREQEINSMLQTQELALVKNTILVQNEERDRIARELHDSIGGNISGIKLQMTNLVERNPEANLLLFQLEKTYQHVRDISHSLIPNEFKENNFTYLIKNYITSLKQNNVIINFNAYPENNVNKLDYKLQSNLFNIIKELITNAFKHAKASEIAIQLNVIEEENSIEFLYEDDGVGFNIKNTSKGIGILNIKHRVKAFNGLFLIDSALNRGTVITISIPYLIK